MSTYQLIPPFSQAPDAENQNVFQRWDGLLESAGRAWVFLSAARIQYQIRSAQLSNSFSEFYDGSSVLWWDRKPVGIWPISLRRTQAGYSFGSQVGPVYPPVFSQDTSERAVKEISGALQDWLSLFRGTHGVEKIDYLFLEGEQSSPAFYRKLLGAGAGLSVLHLLELDLARPYEEIFSGFRKSYRSLIRRAAEKWNAQVHYNKPVKTEFDELRALHVRVAGKETRAAETWHHQQQMVESGSTFLVTIRTPERELIGGSLFDLTKTDAHYAVGVYRRDLEDEALGHLAQDTAIRFMIERGVKNYIVGYRHYPQDYIRPSEKDLGISQFKEGFGGRLRPEFHVTGSN